MRVGAERRQRLQAAAVAPAPTTRPGPEPLGDLHRHRPGVAGRAEHEHALAAFWSATRRRSATHEDIAGFIAAAIFATSTPSGSSIDLRTSATAFSAIVPIASSSATK